MMSLGYHPEWSEGAIKPPIFQTSTFIFNSAEEGKRFFEQAYGLAAEREENTGLIYSRINNPNLEILENRLCIWDHAEEGAVFSSGMAAISTVLLEFLNPGDLLLYSIPTYGGTNHFIEHNLTQIGIHCKGFTHDQSQEDIITQIQQAGLEDQLAFIFVESPANPTNSLFDIEMCKRVADYFSGAQRRVLVGVDNTFMGPVWSNPLNHGADLVIYSATKYLGGHSDLIAGAVVGPSTLIERIKGLRTFLGNMASPYTSWLLLRSLETLKVRMEQQASNARKLAHFLSNHVLVNQVYYLGLLTPGHPDYNVYRKQYTSSGAMLSFEIMGGEEEAFRFLNNLSLIKIAVSLGSTESLAQHPYTMTHAGMSSDLKKEAGITPSLIRISVGLEHHEDIIMDVKEALDEVHKHKDQETEESLMLAYSN